MLMFYIIQYIQNTWVCDQYQTAFLKDSFLYLFLNFYLFLSKFHAQHGA